MLKSLLAEESKKSKVNIAIVGYGKVAKDFHIKIFLVNTQQKNNLNNFEHGYE